jgi:hypothetical protein
LAFGQQLRLAAGLRRFLATPIGAEEAERELRDRIAAREERFLEVARRLVYEHDGSPYRPLLQQAGCEYGDLEASVRDVGVDATLSKLAAAGVRVTVEDIKRDGPAFDNPFFLGRAVRGATSGTSGRPTRVRLDWDSLAEEAAAERTLYAAHGLERAPLALWLPGLPGLAGIRNVLVNAKFGRPPQVWYTPSESPRVELGDRARTAFLVGAGTLAGARLPRPVPLPLTDGARLARWLAPGRRVLSAFAGPALRVAAAAVDEGIDLTGSVVFATGEPLTERRKEFLEASGARAFARYATAESGLIGGGCPEARNADEMHVYLDRIAAVNPDGALLITSVSAKAPKVLVNADLGDTAAVEHRRCGCSFGEVGFDVLVSSVRSSKLLTAEGATVLARELDDIVGALVVAAGGRPDDYQVRESQGEPGRVTLAIAPDLAADDDALVTDVLRALERRDAAGRVAAQLWRDAGTLQVVRERPRLSPGAKLATVRPEPRP